MVVAHQYDNGHPALVPGRAYFGGLDNHLCKINLNDLLSREVLVGEGRDKIDGRTDGSYLSN
jgi:hypothetical protein